ncbi:MAG TPA: NHL repeat-containing protein, partial [Acidobacteriaceae bacterium]|nr:NHL repeat-containing protein [Acidobacteriaceae bacterium]
MNRRPCFRLSGSVVSTLLLASCGFALSAAPMQAQVVAPTTAVGSTSTPPPATVTITTAGMLSQIAVVTQGAANHDYKEASPDGGTCSIGTVYAIGDTCTVQYTFKPTRPWMRYGGISLSDANGVLLGNTYLTGKGTGPQVSYPPSATTVPATLIGNTAGAPVGIVVDGNGNVYFTDLSSGSVKEIVAVGGVIPASPTVNTLATFVFPRAIAIDGSGNLFVADSSANVVKEIVAVGGAIPASPVIRTVGSGFSTPSGVAVDGNGNLYVADSNNAAVKQVVAENGVISTSPTINSLATGVDATGIAVDAAGDIFFTNGSAEIDELAVETGSPVKVATVANLIGLAIDGAGDLYVPDNINKAVYEIVAVGGVIPANPTPVTLGTGFSSPNGVAVDGAGNVFVADSGSVDEFSVQTPPTVTFTSTAAGTTSSDSPMILTVGNNGNVDLHFTSANTTAGFSVDIGSPCNIGGAPIGKNCTYSISFDPLAIGPVSGSLTLQNNNLNDANGAGTQVVPLAGGVASPTIAVPDVSAAVDTTAVPLSATITYDGVMPNVTGTVTFTVNGLPAGGITATCTGAASPLTCTATYDDSSLAAGGAGYKIVASFAGDTSNNPETGTGTLTVNPGTPGMTLVTSGSPATVDT